MDEATDRINALFKNMAARKISIISRLSDLTDEERKIMKLSWMKRMTDQEICIELGMSPSTLWRKRKEGYRKVLDSLDLYGYGFLTEFQCEDLLDYDGIFYLCQDELVRFFLRSRGDRKAQLEMLRFLLDRNGIPPEARGVEKLFDEGQ